MSKTIATLIILSLLLLSTAAPGAKTPPPDVEVAELQGALAEDPADIDAWIRLGDLQRFMGYRTEGRASLQTAADLIKALPDEEKKGYAGDYYLARAWMEYDKGDWAMAKDLAEVAVRHDPRTDTYLVRGLATASFQYGRGVYHSIKPPEIKRTGRPIWHSFSQGPANGIRNRFWFSIVRVHTARTIDQQTYERCHVAYFRPPYFWAEMECRRDWGAYFEDKAMWAQARQMYIWSYERSPVSEGDWATRHERHTIHQGSADKPMLFWTNVDGGYITGSPLAYADYACEMMLNAPTEVDRVRWANNLAYGSTRCLAVLTNHPLPWLWRGLADLFRGDLEHGRHDIAQARAEFDAIGEDHPLYAFAFGHEMLMKRRYGATTYWLEQASKGMPETALVWSELGLAYARTHRPTEAVDAFSRAIVLEPGMVSAWYNRGLVHMETGRPAEAKSDFVRALEIDSTNQEILTRIQLAHVMARQLAAVEPAAATP